MSTAGSASTTSGPKASVVVMTHTATVSAEVSAWSVVVVNWTRDRRSTATATTSVANNPITANMDVIGAAALVVVL